MNHRKGTCIIMIVAIVLMMMGCANGHGTKHVPQPTDIIYTQKVAMSIYGYQPVWALQIIDSAVIKGNLSEVRADVNRARIYSQSLMAE